MVGNELLSQAEIKIGQDGIAIKKIRELDTMLLPNYILEESIHDTAHITCKKKRNEVERLLEDY